MTQNTATQKKEFTMVQAFALWQREAKSGRKYFSGKDENGNNLVGFYNTKKKNPKEPDLRIYLQDDEHKGEVYVSMWMNVSKGGNKYLSGKMGDNRIVGFVNEKGGKRPYIAAYYSEDAEPQKVQAPKHEKIEMMETEETLPF